jgi:hypothetical protein
VLLAQTEEGRHSVLSRSMALRVTTILRITATMPSNPCWFGVALRGPGSEFFGNLGGVPGKTFVADCGPPKPTGSGRVTSRLGDS